jgi:F-type H+-transporting ATPase subunit alpha
LAAFAQFGSDLDPATKRQLDRGMILTEVLKQPQYQPMPVEQEVAIIWAATNGYLDDVPIERVRDFEAQYLDFMRNTKSNLLAQIIEDKRLTDETIEALRAATTEFKQTAWSATPVA